MVHDVGSQKADIHCKVRQDVEVCVAGLKTLLPQLGQIDDDDDVDDDDMHAKALIAASMEQVLH
jgi:hypothetical protein